VAVVTVYSFYRSREVEAASKAGSDREATGYRAAAYATVGFTAWVNAAGALVVFVALAGTDLATTTDLRPSRSIAIAGVFLVPLLPFLITNELVTGSFYEPARFLGQYQGEGLNPALDSSDVEASAGSAQSGGTGDTGGSAGDVQNTETNSSASGSTSVGRLLGVLSVPVSSVGVATRVLEQLGRDVLPSIDTLLTEPNDVHHAFVRSGYIGRIEPGRDQAVNLSVLESMPLIGAPVDGAETLGRTAVDRHRRDRSFSVRQLSPVGATSLLATVYGVLLVLLYLEHLWFHHMLTVRYRHPLYPLAVVFLAWTPPVERVLGEQTGTALGSHLLTVVVCLPSYVLTLAAIHAVQGRQYSSTRSSRSRRAADSPSGRPSSGSGRHTLESERSDSASPPASRRRTSSSPS
jgi:hypothetical protein